MDQCEVYSTRGSALESAVTLPRSHGKLKRNQGDLMDDAVKLSSIKVSRHSPPPPASDGLIVVNTSETNAMSVLPRLLRTMTNRNSQATNGNRSTVENNQISNGELSFSMSVPPGSTINDCDSSSSSSSFISNPSSGSSLISFLSPGHLGPVAAMAAVALSTAVTTMSVNDIQESSGLVTLATASSLIEKEWRARASVVNSNDNVNNAKEQAETTLAVQHHTDLLASAIQANVDRNQQFSLDGSPPLVIGALNTPSSQSLLNESTPVTRAVLNVQSLAAFIRETQKQCSISSPTTSIELPMTPVFPLQTETKLTPSCTIRQVASPSYLLPTASTPSFLSMTPVPQNLPTVLDQPLHSESLTLNHNPHPSPPIQSTAFISLQPAPGSIISPSDLQQLVASGEFMSSAARQTLLGQSSDGSTRQLYLLVPSDCPVIMPRVSNNQPTMTPILPSTSPLIESIPTSAPILEAISPGVEPEENCVQMQSESSTCNNTQAPTSVSHLATTMLNPMSSASTTALSTFLAGLEARNHQPMQQIQLGGLSLSTIASSLSCSYSNSSSAHTIKDSLAPSCSKLRIPLPTSGLPISDNGLLSVEENIYPVTNDAKNSILGVIKSDPDMYTPNGHTYSSLVDEATRFRSYPTYNQQLSSHHHHHQNIPSHNTTTVQRQSVLAASTTSTSSFFQQDSSNSLLVNQTCSVLPPSNNNNNNNIASNNTNTTIASNTNSSNNNNNNNNNTNKAEETLTNGHFQSSLSHSTIPPTTTFTASLAPNSDKTPQMQSSSSVTAAAAAASKSNTSVNECRRNSVTNTIINTSSTSNRSEQVKGSTTYLEHLNPESKDIRRRVSHNEVERRRRDRINTWISELYKLLPPDEQTKSQYQSKGIVLKRVCEYFQNVDSMLKAANSAVEQIRVENSILRQRVHELQQENQLLSASLQLGAAAAAAHLKTRQPSRSGCSSALASININHTNTTTTNNANEGNNNNTTTTTATPTGDGGGMLANNNNNHDHCTILKDSLEFTDYQSPLTVFTVDTNNMNYQNHNHNNNNNPSVNFNSNCLTPTNSLNNNNTTATPNNNNNNNNNNTNPTCFTTSLASINSIGGFHLSQNTISSSNSDLMNQVLCPLTLPSLDHITMSHTDNNNNNNSSSSTTSTNTTNTCSTNTVTNNNNNNSTTTSNRIS